MSLSLPRPAKAPPRTRKTRRPTRRAWDWNAILRKLRRRGKQARGIWRKFRAAPRPVQIVVSATLFLALFSAVNLAYQVWRKPTEMLFPVSGALDKMPAETWHRYAPLFRAYSTAAISPELLAALAQHEGAGNPVAHTYWRWRLTWRPFSIFAPASSAVGMYQMTDGAFDEAQRFCIRHHDVVEDCWFTGLYTRILPSHAIELASIYLDRHVAALLADRRRPATAQQKQAVAIIIHLCGAGPARAFVRRGFRLAPGARCGDHDAALYLSQVDGLVRQFQRLAAAEP